MAISKIGTNSINLTAGLTVADGDITLASGHGIDFSATANVSGTGGETLDDFEEGSFSVTLETASGSATINSSYDVLSYTKIGHLVVVTGGIRVGSVSSPDGQFTINSVPFTPKSTSEDTHVAQISVLHDTLTGVSGSTACVGQLLGGNPKMFIFTQEDSGVADMGNHLQSGSIIRIQCAYLTAS